MDIDTESEVNTKMGKKQLHMMFEGEDHQALQTLTDNGTVPQEDQKVAIGLLDAICGVSSSRTGKKSSIFSQKVGKSSTFYPSKVGKSRTFISFSLLLSNTIAALKLFLSSLFFFEIYKIIHKSLQKLCLLFLIWPPLIVGSS